MRDPSPTLHGRAVPCCVLVPAINRMILTVVSGKACTRCVGERKEVSVGSLHGEEVHNFYSTSNIINVIKSQNWDGRDG
jgi:hypothetical protein